MTFKHTLLALAIALQSLWGFGQLFQGTVTDSETGNPLSNVEVKIAEDNITASTNSNGQYSLTAYSSVPKTLSFELNGYMFEEFLNQSPQTNFNVQLRAKKLSTASLRMQQYEQSGCYVSVPNNPGWDVSFQQSDLSGDLAPNSTYTRRDPSAVIEVNGTYYVWYSYSLTFDYSKMAPWDYNDLYYATSTDGYNWTERGAAVVRGSAGSYDARSVFTTEIFVHNGTYYLVYQAAADADGIYNRNSVGMAYASSPNGPWTKLASPVLRPTYTDLPWFDNNASHDPCIIYYNNKFYLYYKGECSGCYNPCGGKQVKWGVAIANSPTGPYVKSEYNPVTNTGHEVSVWNYNGGVAILQHKDGPEANTIQFAADGVNFEIMGSVLGFPESPGLFRPDNATSIPTGGVEWGICHVLNSNVGPTGWMNLRRFDRIGSSSSSGGSSSGGSSSGASSSGGSSSGGSSSGSGIIIEAESFLNTGGTYNDASAGGPGLGVYATASAINYVNSGDWVEYSINVTQAGDYSINYQISSPSNNAQITFIRDGSTISVDDVENNGSWDSYVNLTAVNNVSLTSGSHSIRLEASGSDTWQWNLDKTILTLVGSSSGGSSSGGSSSGGSSSGGSSSGGSSSGGSSSGGSSSGGSSSGATCDVPYLSNGTTITQETKTWTTGAIDISCVSSVNVSMQAKGEGPMETSDYLNVYYKLDGGSQVALLQKTDSFTEQVVSKDNLSGNILELIVTGKTSYSDEIYTVSDISVVSNGGSSGGSSSGGSSSGGSSSGGSSSGGGIITVEAEDLSDQGGTYNDGHVPVGVGINPGVGIDWINNGDWAEYNVSIPQSGAYEVVYNIASPYSNRTIQFNIDGTLSSTTTIPNTGGWESYQLLTASSNANLEAGNRVIRLNSGTIDRWTWNLDKFTLEWVSAIKDAQSISYELTELIIYPNPASEVVNIILDGTIHNDAQLMIYQSTGSVVHSILVSSNELQLYTGNLSDGMYILKVINGTEVISKSFFKN